MAGSVAKDSKTNKWYFVLELGKDEKGNRKQKKKRGFRTKKEAELALAESEVELARGTYIEPSKLTLKDYMENWMLERKLAVKEYTQSVGVYFLNNYIVPYIGSIRLENLTHIQLQAYINTLVEDSGLSSGTIHKILDYLNVALKKAVKTKVIKENPLEFTTRPKLTKREMKVWNLEQINYFLQNAKNVKRSSRYYIGYALALLTGMRQGEVLGLRWSDINLKDGVIYVRQTLSHNGKLQTGTKTTAGIRSIQIPKLLINELIEQKKIRENEKEHNIQWNNHDLVICTKEGNPVIPTNFYKSFKVTVQKLGLPEITFHQTRHSHATMLLMQKIHPKIVAERLGHSRVGITLDTYSHVLPSMQKEVADELDAIFSNQS